MTGDLAVGRDDLDKAVQAYRGADAAVRAAEKAASEGIAAARDERTAARERLHAAIVAAAQAGVRPGDISAVTGYSRERVRTILRDGGGDYLSRLVIAAGSGDSHPAGRLQRLAGRDDAVAAALQRLLSTLYPADGGPAAQAESEATAEGGS